MSLTFWIPNPLAMGSALPTTVMDGFEAGGGGDSVSITLSCSRLEKLGFTEERAKARIWLLDGALTFWCASMAAHLVLTACMLLAGADSIRDVMAFPKTSGSDLMSALLHLFQ